MRILVVDDDQLFTASVHDTLKEFYAVDVVNSVKAAEFQMATVEYDAVILDFNLPEPIGPQLCERWRAQGVTIPFLMLTGRDATADKVVCFDLGADDYLTKPFHRGELISRLRALLRRSHITLPKTPNITFGDLTLNLTTHTVHRGGRLVPLRRKDFQLLEFFIRHRGRVITREMLIEHLWDSTRDPSMNTVDVHIKSLRDRLDKPFPTKFLRTIYGLGYRFDIPQPPLHSWTSSQNIEK